ncbi:hypothetical protein, partial [Paenarthrobacter nitroguajacolicus]|uniref:hypothetical protein n=1 Tax=Paenarthrobacter nitroguajacolicus TaxID=211146 RepID=UPI00248C997E
YAPGAPLRGLVRTPFVVRFAPVRTRRALSWAGSHPYTLDAPGVTGAIGGYGCTGLARSGCGSEDRSRNRYMRA